MAHSVTSDSKTLAFRPLGGDDAEAVLRATLSATDHGMLLTALDMTIIAVNRRFGEIFDVDPWYALELGMEPLRALIKPTVVRADEWMQRTTRIYDDPKQEFEDSIEIRRDRRIVLHRYSGPVLDPNGEIIARLWTYRDVTREVRLREMQQIMVRVSSIAHADPQENLNTILHEISEYYEGTTAILTILDGEIMHFRGMVGPPSALTGLTRNPIQDSYCQFALDIRQPIIIQDSRVDPRYSCIPAASAGITRYLGVPVTESTPEPVGSLCFLDDRSEVPLDDLDKYFMSMLAMRVSAELVRERNMHERMAEQRKQIERQRADITATNAVLESMNAAFALLGDGGETDSILSRQAELLVSVLENDAAAVLIRTGAHGAFVGYVAHPNRVAAITIEPFDAPEVAYRGVGVICDSSHRLCRALQVRHVEFALREEEGVGELLVIFGQTNGATGDARREMHLEALADQVSLLLATHVLQKALVATNHELTHAQDQLLRKEKLSIAGTLAASTAHDIRNILASLSLLLSPGSKPSDDTLDAIREQIRRFDVLAHRLLSYARPRAVIREPVDLAALLDSVLALTAGQLRVGSVRASNEIGRDLPPILGDPHELEHLFVNLILNAVQAMDNRGGELRVCANATGTEIHVDVIDDGRGIPVEVHSRLFEPFASTRSDGFGLGLYSCRRIVQNHGGSISARRNDGRGSTFTMQFPLNAVHS